ncbi:MAG: hypothetical protein HRT44_12365 [Bdellovibrionales bacterium]|nr:hypothetical protein [Bdellovibrionales bacterium]NQZ20032.1 hypothetical protein [Bdellovibrionales bacterium]
MNSILRTLCLLAAVMLSMQATAVELSGEPENWVYDAGPNPNTEMGLQLIQLNARIPFMPGLSEELLGEGKFRAPFGPIPWRMLQKPNSVKILFIGQDGTHIAEAAGRPATAGFGGRAHDLANHFGVDYSAAFINTYAFTIYGQYGDYGVPYKHDNGKIGYTRTFLTNELWMLSQGQLSPVTQWRNDLIDWIIRNNKESLKMIVTFGGSAKDTISSYIVSRGGNVGTRTSERFIDREDVQVAEYSVERAGGNFTFPVPVDRFGNDLYKKYLAEEMKDPSKIRISSSCKRSDQFEDYLKSKGESFDSSRSVINSHYEDYEQIVIRQVMNSQWVEFPIYKKAYNDCDPEDQQWATQQAFARMSNKVMGDMVFKTGGISNSGVMNAAQMGGYDLNKIMTIFTQKCQKYAKSGT